MTASRILVVDDEADIRGLLKEILSEEGYEVEVAADATQARSSRAAQVPDLVLLDINMPGRSGLDVLAELTRQRPGTPVLVLSVSPEEDYALRCLKLGAAGYLTKQSASD